MENEISFQTNTFDTFIEDDSNKIALEAARTVAINSSREFNPLWLYSQSGCGKTHVLNAITHEIAMNSSKTILYFPAKTFFETMLSYYWKKDNEWLNVEKTDILIIDNMEEFRGKNRTQEEIANIILKKCENNSRVVLASACPYTQLPIIENVLRRGSEATLFAEIQLPSDILKQKYIDAFLTIMPFPITDEARSYLIQNVTTIPELKGILQTACFYNLYNKKEIDSFWAERNVIC